MNNRTVTGTESKLPPWFKQRVPAAGCGAAVPEILDSLRLNTVCESALCPNRTSCYARGTATFMVLGATCTRNCTFCAVGKGSPAPPDPEEPRRTAEAVKALNIKYAVITSVTRDDLPDEGAAHFAETVKAVKEINPGVPVELLIPDIERSEKIMEAGPDVIGHNLETVPRLYPRLRPEAGYNKSLGVLSNIKRFSPGTLTKSGIMLGLGETEAEIEKVMDDLRDARCDILTLGQYLQPSGSHYPVKEYIRPEAFEKLKQSALARGFRAAASAPLVRSSYRAHEIFSEISNGNP